MINLKKKKKLISKIILFRIPVSFFVDIISFIIIVWLTHLNGRVQIISNYFENGTKYVNIATER